MEIDGEATTPQESASSESNAVEIMTGTGLSAADLEAQLLAADAEEDAAADGGGEESESTNEEDENQNAEQKDEIEEKAAEDATDDKETDDEDETLESKEKLSPEHQAIFDKRIGKEVAKRKTLEEDLEKERSETTKLQEQLEALTVRLEEDGGSVQTDVHPLLLAESEKDIEEWEERYWEFKKWSKRHKDGYNGQDAQGNEISYTPEDIAARMDDLSEEKERYLPKAREQLRKRGEYEGKVKEVYPELFDRKTSEYREMLSVVKAVPGLKQLPDYKLVIGDILAGRKVRQTKPEKTQEQETAEKEEKQRSIVLRCC